MIRRLSNAHVPVIRDSPTSKLYSTYGERADLGRLVILPIAVLPTKHDALTLEAALIAAHGPCLLNTHPGHGNLLRGSRTAATAHPQLALSDYVGTRPGRGHDRFIPLRFRVSTPNTGVPSPLPVRLLASSATPPRTTMPRWAVDPSAVRYPLRVAQLLMITGIPTDGLPQRVIARLVVNVVSHVLRLVDATIACPDHNATGPSRADLRDHRHELETALYILLEVPIRYDRSTSHAPGPTSATPVTPTDHGWEADDARADPDNLRASTDLVFTRRVLLDRAELKCACSDVSAIADEYASTTATPVSLPRQRDDQPPAAPHLLVRLDRGPFADSSSAPLHYGHQPPTATDRGTYTDMRNSWRQTTDHLCDVILMYDDSYIPPVFPDLPASAQLPPEHNASTVLALKRRYADLVFGPVDKDDHTDFAACPHAYYCLLYRAYMETDDPLLHLKNALQLSRALRELGT
eukprot:gene3327-3829_t